MTREGKAPAEPPIEIVSAEPPTADARAEEIRVVIATDLSLCRDTGTGPEDLGDACRRQGE